jgi:hypothetical protein
MSGSERTTFPIVGMKFRPPAQVLINALAVGTPLTAIAEPENAYDPNAIAIWLYTKDIPEASQEALKETALSAGWTHTRIMAEEVFHLGYIPKEMAAELKASGAIRDNEPQAAEFLVSAQGQARVHFV